MCGITGVISNNNIFELLCESLFHLQHRGQNAYGLSIYDITNKINIIKNTGILNDNNIEKMDGMMGLGHLRYPTSGIINDKEIQPFVLNNIVLCHNGTIANYKELIVEYKNKISMNSESDSELLLNIFCYELKNNMNNEEKLTNETILKVIKIIYNKCKGGYSVIIMIPEFGLVCFKDPYGIRPLVYGKYKENYIISSESVSISNLCEDSKIIKEIEGGETVILKNINNIIKTENYKLLNKLQKPCIFEWIYIAREDSIIHDVSVYKSRLKMGEYLAKRFIKENININELDLIIPIPDTSRPIALKISEVLNICYREAIVKNRYIGRTFIMDNQVKRKKNIRRKLSVIKEFVENKNILIVDDSIVRGNTIHHIIDMLYKNNVKSIIVASCAPIIKYQNFYGLDIPTKEELIGNNRTIKEIENKLNIKKLVYLTIDEICKSISDLNPKLNSFELSVFNGEYIH